MRKFILPILLAGVASGPAFAAPGDQADRDQARAERQQAREAAREERSQERATRTERVERAPKVERVETSRDVQAGDTHAHAHAVAGAPQRDVDQIRAAREADRNQRFQQREDRHEEFTQQRESLRQSKYRTAPVPVVSNTPRPGTQPPVRVERRHNEAPSWSTNWRHNDKYDWKKHRNRYRWVYHLGSYYDPYGWNYYPYQIGWRLWPSYYSNRYWINDPWQYRLPYAPPGYRWVRYWDDAVLVDTWSGQVVDVIYNFFW